MIVEARGFSGGIWILWNKNDISISAIQSREHFLHVETFDNLSNPWLLIVVYASPRVAERVELWDNILNISYTINSDW